MTILPTLKTDLFSSPVAMVIDPPADSSTPLTIRPGESLDGQIDSAGDQDWIAIELAAGETVKVTADGSGDTPLGNPKLEIYGPDESLLTDNDNGGAGRNAALIFTAQEAGTYYIDVAESRDTGTGGYTLAVTPAEPPDPLASLDWAGSRVPSNTITVYFAPDGASLDRYETEAFNDYELQQFQAAFDLVESVADVTFVITDDPNADLRIGLDTDEIGNGPRSFLGFFNPPTTRDPGVGIFNGAAWDREAGGGLEIGGNDFVTISHELLHALGMSHPHDTGGQSEVMSGVGTEFDDFGDYDLNQGVFTTMSYNAGNPAGVPGDPGFDFGYEAGPMALDIAVLQDKYGANTTYAGGNDTYHLPDQNQSGTYWLSIWDTGGSKDAIRYNGDQDSTIDLRAATLQTEEGGGGFLSSVEGIAGGYTIANGVVIENAFSGSGDDMLMGNDADNTLKGGKGNDTVEGGDGADRVEGGSGNDMVQGGADDDRVKGGSGADTAYGGAGDDEIVGQGGNDDLFGDAGHDDINGNGGSDRIYGGDGMDTINAGGGRDLVYGDKGDDEIHAGKGNDTVWGSEGDDLIYGTDGKNKLGGGKGDDMIWAGKQAEMFGNSGDDTLNSGLGDDTMWGGSGADEFSFIGGTDVIGDFKARGDLERIDITAMNAISSFADLQDNHMTQVGNDVVIDALNGDTLTLLGVSMGDLDSFEFLI